MTTRFNWTDPDIAKNEYGDFLATLQEELGRDQCILTDGSIMRPVPPPTVTPTGVAIDTLQLHGYQHAYRKEYNEFQAKFSNGISIVNKLHVMNSPARRLFHQHTDDSGKPAAMATADWMKPVSKRVWTPFTRIMPQALPLMWHLFDALSRHSTTVRGSIHTKLNF